MQRLPSRYFPKSSENPEACGEYAQHPRSLSADQMVHQYGSGGCVVKTLCKKCDEMGAVSSFRHRLDFFPEYPDVPRRVEPRGMDDDLGRV